MVERAILTALVVLSVLTVMTRVGVGLNEKLQQAVQAGHGGIVAVDSSDSTVE